MSDAPKNTNGQKKIEVFVEGEGLQEIILVPISPEETLQALLDAAKSEGLTVEDNTVGFLGTQRLTDRSQTLSGVGIKNHTRVHFHRCEAIPVAVSYNGLTDEKKFLPSQTVHDVREWALNTDGFNIDPGSKSTMILQLRTGARVIKGDVQLGTLASHPVCEVQFDLVPDPKFQGTK